MEAASLPGPRGVDGTCTLGGQSWTQCLGKGAGHGALGRVPSALRPGTASPRDGFPASPTTHSRLSSCRAGDVQDAFLTRPDSLSHQAGLGQCLGLGAREALGLGGANLGPQEASGAGMCSPQKDREHAGCGPGVLGLQPVSSVFGDQRACRGDRGQVRHATREGGARDMPEPQTLSPDHPQTPGAGPVGGVRGVDKAPSLRQP